MYNWIASTKHGIFMALLYLNIYIQSCSRKIHPTKEATIQNRKVHCISTCIEQRRCIALDHDFAGGESPGNLAELISVSYSFMNADVT